jgi:hypothetical protein
MRNAAEENQIMVRVSKIANELIIAVFKKKKLETKNSCRDFSIGKIIS